MLTSFKLQVRDVQAPAVVDWLENIQMLATVEVYGRPAGAEADIEVVAHFDHDLHALYLAVFKFIANL